MASRAASRKGHTTSIIGNDLFVFGGCNAPTGRCFNALLKLDLSKMEWSYPKVEGVAPPALSGHTATVVRLPPKDQWAAEDAVASVPFLFVLGGKATSETQDGKEMVYSGPIYFEREARHNVRVACVELGQDIPRQNDRSRHQRQQVVTKRRAFCHQSRKLLVRIWWAKR